MITYFQSTVKEVEAKREYFDYHKKRELEEHLLVKLRSYVLGMSNLFKYRLKIWSSGDISIVAGVQIPTGPFNINCADSWTYAKYFVKLLFSFPKDFVSVDVTDKFKVVFY